MGGALPLVAPARTRDWPYPCHRSAEPRAFICFSSLFRLVVVHFFHSRVGRFPNSDVQEERWKVGLAFFSGFVLAGVVFQ